MNKNLKIIRTWKGWTTIENAPIYEDMLINEVFPTVKKNGVNGLEKVSISTKNKGNEVEFFLTLQFDSMDSVKSFAGENLGISFFLVLTLFKSAILSFQGLTVNTTCFPL